MQWSMHQWTDILKKNCWTSVNDEEQSGHLSTVTKGNTEQGHTLLLNNRNVTIKVQNQMQNCHSSAYEIISIVCAMWVPEQLMIYHRYTIWTYVTTSWTNMRGNVMLFWAALSLIMKLASTMSQTAMSKHGNIWYPLPKKRCKSQPTLWEVILMLFPRFAGTKPWALSAKGWH